MTIAGAMAVVLNDFTTEICLHKLLSSVSCVALPAVTDQVFKGISSDKPLSVLANPGVTDCTASMSGYEMEHKQLGPHHGETRCASKANANDRTNCFF